MDVIQIIQQFGFAVIGIALIAAISAIVLIGSRLFATYVSVRRQNSKNNSLEESEARLRSSLEEAGFDAAEAAEAVRATRPTTRRRK